MIDRPYFMENKDWYRFDFKARKYVLTDKATDKAKQSYVEFYADEEMIINGRTADKSQKRDDKRKERSY